MKGVGVDRRTLLVFSLCATCLLAPAARGDEADRILFVGIRLRSGLHDRAGKAIQKRAERMAEPLVLPDKPLSNTERACRAQECLAKLSASRRVDWILGGEIRPVEGRDSLVTLFLFSARDNKLLDEETPCNACDDDALGNAASTVAGKLLDQRRTPRPAPSLTPPTPPVTLPITAPGPGPLTSSSKAKSSFASRFTLGRGLVLGILGASFLATLTSAILFSTASTNDLQAGCLYHPTSGQSRCSYQPLLQLAGFTLAGVLAAGVVITVVLP